jgi:hypothetical protein
VDDLGGDERKGRLTRNKLSMKESQQHMICDEQRNQYDAQDWNVMERRFDLSGNKPIASYADRSWVPPGLKNNVNEDLNCLGSLWIHRMSANSSRFGNDGFVFDSIGRFILGLDDCQIVVMTWPADKVLELGGQSWLIPDYLELLKGKDQLDDFLTHVKHFPLKQYGACWIPYGWSCCVAAMPTDMKYDDDKANVNHNGISHYLTMSYVNKGLWDKVSEQSRDLIRGLVVAIIMEAYMNALAVVSLYDSNFASVFRIDTISHVSVVFLILSRAVV